MKKRVHLGLLWCSMVLLCALGARGQFVQRQKLLSPLTNSSFGRVIAAANGVVVIGVANESASSSDRSGVVYIFENLGQEWAQTARIEAISPNDKQFGMAVAASSNTVVIKAVNNGLARFYFLSRGGGWQSWQSVTLSSSSTVYEGSGCIALSDNLLAVGIVNPIFPSGVVHLFERDSNGYWDNGQRTVSADDTEVGSVFGSSIAISGSTLLVGDPAKNGFKGKAYLFEKTGNTWQQIQQLLGSDLTNGANFGVSVAMSENRAVVGAPSNDRRRGNVYVFEKVNGSFSPTETRKLSASDPTDEAGFGLKVALAGSKLAVGTGVGYSVNGAYLFEKDGTDWVETQKFFPTEPFSRFAPDLAWSGETLFAGASVTNSDKGVAFLFESATSTEGANLTKARLLPRPDCCAGRTVGGRIQVSAVGTKGPWKTVRAITSEASGDWKEFPVGIAGGKYKAMRYLAPDGGYGNVAELEFYSTNQKLTGEVFADAGGPWNGLQDRTPGKAFDGNANTFYDANNANGAYVGLSLTDSPPPPPTCAVTKVRIFPRTDCCSGRTLGGQIQVSTVGKNGPWQTAVTIGTETPNQWTEFGMPNFLGPYKAVRYVAPSWGYGNVAEIEFYNGETKLSGVVFHDGNGPWSGLQDRSADKAFDGNTNTFYDAESANGAFVGLELESCPYFPSTPECVLTKVVITPRRDCCVGRLVGGRIEGSKQGKSGPWETVMTVALDDGNASSYTLSNGFGSYKAIRYLSPDWSYGNVAELEFYNGATKLTGTVFADPGGPWNGLQDRTSDKAFDGNPNTYYDASNANGAYVGLELTGCSTGTNRLAAPEVEGAEVTWALHAAPNPSVGRVKAHVTLPQASRFTLTLTNVLGQELHRREVPGEAGANAVEVDFSPQPTGLYLLRVQTEGQKPLVQKLLKRTE